MEDKRFMVLVEVGSVTSTAGNEVSRDEAWALAQQLRADGKRVHIVHVGSDGDFTCVVGADEPLAL